MRRHQQRQILDLLRTIYEAQIAGLYSDCQDGAAALGEFIDSIEGDGTETAALLEKYYTVLYQASCGEAGKKDLEECLNLIKSSVKNELKPNKIEVVFLSYKASMSDSIESVYLTAESDPDCDAYWIPIPYFDKNKDGSFGTMHFEGAECYGDNIRCTDWQDYDIEARHPDAVVTFNPYDNVNYVTSVHPSFYCEKLRNFTDLLVYIPYLIHYEKVSPSAAQTAGVFWSHLTFVQSYNVRKQYLDSANMLFKNKECRIAGDRIIALGSPKTDKVFNIKKDDYVLPDCWRHFFQKDGSQKTTVLYNTSIETALANCRADDAPYLRKLKNVFEFFRHNTDTVLWWRPHPLLAQTLCTMRPRLYREYADLVEYYKNQEIGIYDDSSDMHRAIAYADMCYGDDSSLGLLLQIAGKPTLIQNMHNHWSESDTPDSAEAVEQAMERFIEQGRCNSYIMCERPDTSKDGFTLSAFIEHLDMITKYRTVQTEKYRSRYVNMNGASGRAIYKYIKSALEGHK